MNTPPSRTGTPTTDAPPDVSTDRRRLRSRLRDDLRLVESALDNATRQIRRRRYRTVVHALLEPAVGVLAVLGLTLFGLLTTTAVSPLVAILVLVATTLGLVVLVPAAGWLSARRSSPDRLQLAAELDDKLELHGALLTAACEPRTASPLHNRFLGLVRQQADRRLADTPRLPALGPSRREWVGGYAAVILLILALSLLVTNPGFRDTVREFFTGPPPDDAVAEQPVDDAAEQPAGTADDGDGAADDDATEDEGEPEDESDDASEPDEDDGEDEGDAGEGDDGGEGEGESGRTGGTGEGEDEGQQSDASGSGGQPDDQSADQPSPESDDNQQGGTEESEPPPTGGDEGDRDQGGGGPGEEPDWELDPQEVQLVGGEGEREPGTIRVFSGSDGEPGGEEIDLADLLPRLSPARQAGRMAGQRHADDERLIREYYRLLEQLAQRTRER